MCVAGEGRGDRDLRGVVTVFRFRLGTTTPLPRALALPCCPAAADQPADFVVIISNFCNTTMTLSTQNYNLWEGNYRCGLCMCPWCFASGTPLRWWR